MLAKTPFTETQLMHALTLNDDPSDVNELEVYIVGPADISTFNMFHSHNFIVWTEDNITDEMLRDISFAVFTGGADVSPSLYGEENVASYCNPARDELEVARWKLLTEYNVPMVGICRGGQFLNVMNGGKLIQDVSGHSMGYQPVFSPDGDSLGLMHEDHHQAIVPTESSEVIALASDGVVEACFYHETKTLCFQPHPEWGDADTEAYFFKLLHEKKFLS